MKKILIILALFGAFKYLHENHGWMDGSAGSMNRSLVILYATDWCQYCAKTRRFFAENGVLYVEYNIERDPAAKREFDKISRNGGVPVVDAKGTIIYGYNPARLRDVLGL